VAKTEKGHGNVVIVTLLFSHVILSNVFYFIAFRVFLWFDQIFQTWFD